MEVTEKKSASQQLLGMTVTGRAGRVWKVTKEKSVEPGHTPGQFSYTYEVSSEDGRDAFMKASDLGMFSSRNEDFLTQLLSASRAQQFERDILEHCKGNNMDRVVTSIDYGDFETVFDGVRDRVFFIIFELAKSDLRSTLKVPSRPDIVWMLVASRNLFTGIRQLHSGSVCHNDFKPANALVFDDELHKVADLGRATALDFYAPHKGLCVGDFRYAAPEQMYDVDRVTDNIAEIDRRRAGDLYSLGSMIHFLLTKRMVTPEVVQALPTEHKPSFYYGGWQDSFTAVLPFWRLQFDSLMDQMKAEIAAEPEPARQIFEALCGMSIELCEPDPRLRGHPLNRQGKQDPYDLTRYVAALDLLAIRAKVLKR